MKKTALAGSASLLALLIAGLTPAHAQYAQSGYAGVSTGLPGGPFYSSSVPSMALVCVAPDLVHVVPCGGDATHSLHVIVDNPQASSSGGGTATTVAQGAPNTQANAWPVSEQTLDAALQSAAGIKVAIVGTPTVTVSGVATAANQQSQVTAEQNTALATRPDDATSSASAPRTQTHDDQLGAVLTQNTASATVLGTPADTAYSGTGSGTLDAIEKAVLAQLAAGLKVTAQGTTPISAVALPLPAGASTAAAQGTQITAEQAIAAATRTNDAGTSRTQTHDDQLGNTLKVADLNNAAFQGVAAITPDTATTAARSIGFIITTAGNVTLTLADTSTITLALAISPQFQTLPFAVTNVALGSGTAGTFWSLK